MLNLVRSIQQHKYETLIASKSVNKQLFTFIFVCSRLKMGVMHY